MNKGAFYFLIFFSLVMTGCKTENHNRGRGGSEVRPNVIIINVDDLGWKDLGFMGSTYYETPHLDRLASEGMTFTNAYAGAANCAPSRACMISGLNTPRHQIYTVGTSARGDKETRKLIPTPNHEVLPDSVYTIAEMLRDNGYVTGTFGKWHLGDDPLTQGFHVNFGGNHRGAPGKAGYFSPYDIEVIPDGPKGEYLTDRVASEAIKFVQQYSDTTFFLYLPFYAVHTPIMGKKELVEKFEAKGGTKGQHRADYAAMISTMDTNVGRLMRALDSLGLKDNTVVFFTSDNGGIRSVSYQDPLRAGKGSYYEGGIRVPLVVRWPGTVAPGSRSDVPVSNLDFYPTIQSIIHADVKKSYLDGDDISPALKGQTMAERSLFWHFPIYLQAYNPKEDDARDPLFRTRPGTVVRKGEWKLHEYFEDGGLELYNLAADPGETKNLVTENPDKADELLNALRAWREETQAPVPETKNPDYDPKLEQDLIRKTQMPTDPQKRSRAGKH